MRPTFRSAAVVSSFVLVFVAACSSGDETEGAGVPGAGGDGGSSDASTGGGGGTGGTAGAGATGGSSDGGGSGTGGAAGGGGVGTGGEGATGGSGGAGGSGATGGSGGSGGVGGSGATGGSGGSGGTSVIPDCGDGVRNQSWEQCDGYDLGGATCQALVGSNYAGQVNCTASCTFDTQACYCVPDCGGKQCGSDGCGSTCGDCPTYSHCSAGQCVCSDSCAGKVCGTNLCGESCGQCDGNEYCYGGQCVPGCTPDCAGKVCGTDGCGNVCGTCGVDDKCSSGQCSACTKSCPTLTPVAVSTSTQCVARIEDCNTCGPSTCGTPHYAYGCWSGDTPALSGCYKTTSNEYCCPQAACLRYTVADSYCSNVGLPPHAYSCKPGVSAGAGCVIYPSNSDGPVYCCP